MDGGEGFQMRASDITYPPYRRASEEPDSDSDCEHDMERERRHGYRPLNAGEIRLLVLNPGSPEDRIECFLEHYLARNPKPYRALSYVWGVGGKSAIIRVDGCAFEVTENLRNFLVRFRSESDPRVLWIDAVCINQSEILERNAQVRLMKQVYEEADSVVIWLGETVEGTWDAFQAIAYFCRSFGLSSSEPEKPLASIPLQWMEARFVKVENDYHHAWAGIQDLFNRPWWTRVWVYQEATAPARNGRLVLCGSHTIDFAKVLAFNAFLKDLSGRYERFAGYGLLTRESAVNMDVYSRLRQDYYKHGKSNFLRLSDLLPTLRGSGATNPRDKLYSLIPISLDGADLLDVDYSHTVEEVYTDAAISFMQKHKNLDILGHCTGTSRERDPAINLPSWVPDWTFANGCMPFFKRRSFETPDISQWQSYWKLYHASGGAAAAVRYEKTKRKLFCDGLVFDQVDAISPSCGRTVEDTEVVSEWRMWLEATGSPIAINTSSSWASEIASHSPFGQLLVADCHYQTVDVGMRSRDVRSGTEQGDSTSPVINHRVEGRFEGKSSFAAKLSAVFQRRVFVTRKGFVGLTAKHVRPDDVVAVLLGGQLPFILRQIEDHFVLVGEAYVHGIMDGEAMKLRKTEGLRTFEIW